MIKDFEKTIISKFNFLTTDKGFSNPEIITDDKKYKKGVVFRKNKLIIEITNSYHPADYGFAINLMTNKKSEKPTMVYYKTNENQDKELKFLDEGVEKIKSLLS